MAVPSYPRQGRPSSLEKKTTEATTDDKMPTTKRGEEKQPKDLGVLSLRRNSRTSYDYGKAVPVIKALDLLSTALPPLPIPK